VPHYLLSSVSQLEGGIFLFDSSTGKCDRLLRGRFRGMTFGPDGWVYAVTGIRRHDLAFQTRFFRLDPSTGATEDLGPAPWKACHDLRWMDGHFYLVASIGNQVIRLDRSLQPTGRLQVVESDEDICHLNCLAARDGRLFASLFTLSAGTQEDKRCSREWASEGKLIELDFEAETYTLLHEPLAQPHSLVWQENRLLLLESHTSRVTEWDSVSGRARQVAQLTGFLRGMAVGSEEVVVGTSRMFTHHRRSSPSVDWKTRLRERFLPFAGVYCLDPITWRQRRRYSLSGIEIYDILALSPGALSPIP
jgi:hypothetical protein